MLRLLFYLMLLTIGPALAAQNTLFETNPDFPNEYVGRLFQPGTVIIQSANIIGTPPRWYPSKKG
ncbi:MAG: hypothetical protein IPL65_22455 [Lewinellaceae bacterium]|nr:hypothetical protein [Lewinellaceae bacterium]